MKYSPQRGLQLDGMLRSSPRQREVGAARRHLDRHRRLPAAVQPVQRPDEAAVVSDQLLGVVRDAAPPLLSRAEGAVAARLAPPHPGARPLLGPFLPEFTDNRRYKRRDVFTGTPLPDEAEAPLGVLIANCLRELRELGGANGTRARRGVVARCSRGASRRSPGADVGRRRLGRHRLRRRLRRLGRRRLGRWRREQPRRRRRDGRQRMEEMAAETEAQCARELRELAAGRASSGHAAARAVARARVDLRATSGGRLRLPQAERPLGRGARAPRRRLVPAHDVALPARLQRTCPILLTDFDVGERVVQLPGAAT